MREAKISSVTQATVHYVSSWSRNGTHYLVHELVDPQEIVIDVRSESLTQGTIGHNTNMTHRIPEGGGFLPLRSGTSVISLEFGPTVVYEESRYTPGTRENVDYYHIDYWIAPYPYKEGGEYLWYSYTRQITTYRDGRLPSYYFGVQIRVYSDFQKDARTGRWSNVQHYASQTYRGNDPTRDPLYHIYEDAMASSPSPPGRVTMYPRAISGAPLDPDYTHVDLGDRQWIKDRRGPFLNYVGEVRAAAFIDACNQFPRQADNQIANMLEVLGMFRGALNPEEVLKSMTSVIGSLKSFWMWWRYGYTTAMSDIYQAVDYAFRKHMSMWNDTRYDGFANQEIHVNGYPVTVSCHCGFRTHLDAARLYANTGWVKGLELNTYTVWDLIPLSFVIDWFTGTGDVLEYRNALRHYLSDYRYSDMFFTTTYRAEVERNTGLYEETYTREYAGPPSILRGSYLPNEGDPSTVTLIKRSIDVLSLVQV